MITDSPIIGTAVGKQIVSIDLFDKPSTCRKVWDRLLTGVIMDALEAAPAKEPAGKTDAERLLSALRNSSWEQTEAVGVGDEYRYGSEDEHASALVFDETVAHGSLVVAG